MNAERRIDELLEAISNNDKYNDCVFSAPGIYFVIGNGKLWEISDDASSTPKGGWFPNIVSGPTVEENECLTEMMDELGFDEFFFSDLIDYCGDFDDADALEYFEDNDDEESAKIYRQMKKRVASAKTPFATMEDFVDAVGRYGLESGRLYYEWEGEFIDLHDNICETGEERGRYDNLDDEGWIELLENIDEHIVR